MRAKQNNDLHMATTKAQLLCLRPGGCTALLRCACPATIVVLSLCAAFRVIAF
jgi:hypothetical protein